MLELSAGRARLRIAPHLGGRATACWLEDGRGELKELLHPCPELGPGTDLMFWPKGGLYPLAPYSGRIAHARLHHGGEVLPLAPHPEVLPHTLHGSAHREAWSVVEQGLGTARLVYEHAPDVHWPWRYRAELSYELERNRLGVALEIKNTDDCAAPAGLGLHPYLANGEEVQLQFDAAQRWRPTPETLCSGSEPLEAGHEFHQLGTMPSPEFTMFYGGWSGKMTIRRKDGARFALHASALLSHLIVFRPAGPGYFCIEPVSHVVDAFTLHAAGVPDTGARTLQPGEALAGRCDFTCE